MEKDILYKALTRPALVMGLPLQLLILIIWLTIMLCMFISFYFIGVGIFTYIICVVFNKKDEMFFFIIAKKMFASSTKASLIQSKRLFKKNIDYVSSSSYRDLKVENNINLKNFTNIEKYFPYSSHIDEHIIINKNGDLVATWEVKGISFEGKNDDELDQRKNELDNFIRSFSNEKIVIHINVIKKDTEIKIQGDFSKFWFAQENNDRYIKYLKGQKNKKTNIYVSLIMKGSTLQDKTDNFINMIFSKIFGKNSVNLKEKQNLLDRNLNSMKDLCFRFTKGLEVFEVRQLGLYEKDGYLFSELIDVYNLILNGVDRNTILDKTRLSNLLASTNYYFGERTITTEIDDKSIYMKCVEIKTYSNETNQGIFDYLMSLPYDINITQTFGILSADDSVKLLNRKKKQFESSKDQGVSQINKIDDFIDLLASNDIAMGEYSFSVFIRANDFDDVQEQTKRIIQQLNNKGFIAQEASISLKPNFFAQLPSNLKYRTRVIELTSKNFAGMTGLHNFSTGKLYGNCWGDALTVLETRSGQPYYLNLHEEHAFANNLGDELVGNFVIIGGTGAGKTVLASWLLEQSLKFNSPSSFPKNILKVNKQLKFVYFDKDRAVQMHILALGGKYITLKKGIITNLNPFMIENTEENRNFLVNFIKILCTLDGGTVSVLQEEEIYRAVSQVMARTDRRYGISLLLQTLNIEHSEEKMEKSIYVRLQKWSRDGFLGWMFDNDVNDLNINDYNVFGIDGTEFLDDKEMLEPLMYYILHVVKNTLNGQRVGIFADEIQKYAACETLDNMFDDLFRVIRKLNGIIGGATQDMTSIEHTKTYNVLLTQTETRFVLPENVYRKDYYVDRLKFSDKEFELLQTLNKSEREFLIKKTSVDSGKPESIICKLNLSCLGENLRILSIGASARKVADTLIEKTQDPRVWIKELGNLLDTNGIHNRENNEND